MVISAHWIKVVIRIIEAMSNEALDGIASATENICQLVTNTAVNDDSDGDGAFAPFVSM